MCDEVKGYSICALILSSNIVQLLNWAEIGMYLLGENQDSRPYAAYSMRFFVSSILKRIFL